MRSPEGLSRAEEFESLDTLSVLEQVQVLGRRREKKERITGEREGEKWKTGEERSVRFALMLMIRIGKYDPLIFLRLKVTQMPYNNSKQ